MSETSYNSNLQPLLRMTFSALLALGMASGGLQFLWKGLWWDSLLLLQAPTGMGCREGGGKGVPKCLIEQLPLSHQLVPTLLGLFIF